MKCVISIIVPVFNDFSAIQQTITALRGQTAEKELFEIIVIDNGSTDGSVEWLSEQTDIIFIQEHTYLNSPYSCRNRGAEVASGRYLVFLDSTCVPDEKWLEAGLKFSEIHPDSMFGGRVRFHCNGHKTTSKLYDSITHVQMEQTITEKQEAKTANLWTSKEIFVTYGPFREGVRSGEDVRWSKYCSDQGVPLLYSQECMVYKFARGFSELMNKQFRIGKGQIARWKKENVLTKRLLQSIKYFVPMKPSSLRERVAKNEEFQFSFSLALKLYLIDYSARFMTSFGNIAGLIQRNDEN
jgi:glycosyltransferase involved in cell wall biosynthesis